ncbi:hypothetical protein [Ilyobacter sp.]|uniref:hypothetical protein n=1 Tax=Ilyobacter sp. TaxID=3100343 RepID=UPI0035699B24
MKKLLIALVIFVGGITANADIIWDRNTTLGDIVKLGDGTEFMKDEKVMAAMSEMIARGYSKGYSDELMGRDLQLRFSRLGEDAMMYLFSNIDGEINLSKEIIKMANNTYRD